MSFGLLQGFMSHAGVYTKTRAKRLLLPPGVDYSNFVNHNQVQVLSYTNYSFLPLPVVGIEPETSS